MRLRVLRVLLLAGIGLLATGGAMGDAAYTNPVHIGDDAGSRWVPQDPVGISFSWKFNPGESGTLQEIRFSGVNDVETGLNLLSVDGQPCMLCDVGPSEVRLLRGGNAIFSGEIAANGDVSLSPGININAGNYTLEVEAGTYWSGTAYDDIDWDRIDVVVGAAGGGGGQFNAVEPGEDPVSGPIFTQIAGSDITLDIAALDPQSDGLSNNYNGQVTVELIDALDNSGTLDSETGCRDSWGANVAITLGTVDFSATNDNPVTHTFSPGYAEALREARIRLTGTRGKGGGQTDTACSADAFAVRPDRFQVEAAHDDRSTAFSGASPGAGDLLDGTSGPDAGPVHEAGRPFTIRATAVNTAGTRTTGYEYGGAPTAANAGLVMPTGGTPGQVAVEGWLATAGGIARTDTASYDEVGIFTLALTDADFASVDAGDGTPLERRRIGPSSVDVGRFVPARFEVTANEPRFGDASGTFTYMGQPFSFAAGNEPVITIEALNAAGESTQNYGGQGTGEDFWRLETPARTYSDATPAGAAASFAADQGPGGVTWGDGSGSDSRADYDGAATLTISGDEFRFRRTQIRQSPFQARVDLTLVQGELTDLDAVCFDGNDDGACEDFVLDADGDAGGQQPITGTELRYGRLVVGNAHGPETQDLAVPVRAEYWNGTAFQVNEADDTTELTVDGEVGRVPMDLRGENGWSDAGDSAVDLIGGSGTGTTSGQQGFLSGGVGPGSPMALTGGTARLVLDGPGAGNTGFSDVRASLFADADGDGRPDFPWLGWDWDDADGDGNPITGADNPVGRATFGRYRGHDRILFWREVYD